MFHFRRLNQDPVEVELKGQVSGDQIMATLKENYNYPVGSYQYVYNGQLLDYSNPLANVPEGSEVIVLVDHVQKPTNFKHSCQCVSFHLDIPPNPEETMKLSAQLGGPTSPTFAFRELSIVEDKKIKNAIDILKLNNIYGNSFWDHPEAAANLIKTLDQNPHLIDIVEHFAMTRFASGLTRTNLFFAPMLMCGIPCHYQYEIGETFDAAHASLTDKQREEFAKVAQLKMDKDKMMKTFLNNGCNAEATIKILRGE